MRTDPGAARGSQVYPPERHCRCSHAEVVHELTAKKVRTWCRHADATGQCPCRVFEVDEAWAETLFDQRDAALAAVHRVRELHTDSVAGVCPSCGDLADVGLGGDGLVNYPCPTIRALDGEVSSHGD